MIPAGYLFESSFDNSAIHNKGITGIDRAKTTQNATDRPFLFANIPVGTAAATVITVKTSRLDIAASAIWASIPSCASAAVVLGSSMYFPLSQKFTKRHAAPKTKSRMAKGIPHRKRIWNVQPAIGAGDFEGDVSPLYTYLWQANFSGTVIATRS